MVTLSDRELQVITQGATNAHKAQRGFLPLTELVNEAVLWALEHGKKVEMWREKGKYGENLLRFSSKQHCLSVVSRERRKRYQLHKGDTTYYSTALVRELLPDIFDPEDWVTGQVEMTDHVGGVSRPSEGNNRLAMMMDITSAYYSLNDTDQALLRDLHADGGVPKTVLADTMGVADKTVARREQRALQRIVDILGGEVPWWTPGSGKRPA